MVRTINLALGGATLVVGAGLGTREETVTIWDIGMREVLGSFERRTGPWLPAVLSGDPGPLVMLRRAHPQERGLSFVEVSDVGGAVIWSRPDLALTDASALVSSGDGSWIAVDTMTDNGVMLLDRRSGAAVRMIKGVQRVWPGPNGLAVCTRRSSFQFRPLMKGSPLWTRPATIMACAISSESCVYSMGPRLTCLSTRNGEVQWEWCCPGFDRNITSIAWNATSNGWVCGVHNRDVPVTVGLLSVSVEGVLQRETPLGRSYKISLFSDGEHAVLAEGAVVNTASGEVVWTLPIT